MQDMLHYKRLRGLPGRPESPKEKHRFAGRIDREQGRETEPSTLSFSVAC